MTKSVRHLTLFLGKEGIDILALFRNTKALTEHVLVAPPGEEAKLYTKETESEAPWWADFLAPLASDDLAARTSRATSAVLAIKLSDDSERVVCYAFGHGRHLLNPRNLERDFGLRVALNSVDPSRLRGIDSRRQEDVVVNTRIQASAGTDIGAFAINHFRDMFRRASGHTRRSYESVLGQSVKGSVSVTFDVPIHVGELEERAGKLVEIYSRDDYKGDFGFVDNIRAAGPTQAETLDGYLNEALLARARGDQSDFRCLYLAPPEILDDTDVEGFTFSTSDDDYRPATDLDLDDYLKSRCKPKASPSVERARRDTVSIHASDGTSRTLASVYRCIVGEIETAAGSFQIVDGDWYLLEKDFVKSVRQDLKSIPLSSLSYPAYEAEAREDDWNVLAAKALGGILLDKQNVPIAGGSNRIELCDVGRAPGTLIHVKRRSSSSTMSHLWAQGAVALQALLTDKQFRETARLKVEKIDKAHEDLVREGAVGADYEVHFVILGSPATDPVDGLPFFSQVALWQAYRSIRGTGARVHIAALPAVAKPGPVNSSSAPSSSI